MAGIENDDVPVADKFQRMPDEVLVAQDLVQQGAVHAVSYLLQQGCSEAVAVEMLASLRENARLIREEAQRRGKPSLFSQDQMVFS